MNESYPVQATTARTAASIPTNQLSSNHKKVKKKNRIRVPKQNMRYYVKGEIDFGSSPRRYLPSCHRPPGLRHAEISAVFDRQGNEHEHGPIVGVIRHVPRAPWGQEYEIYSCFPSFEGQAATQEYHRVTYLSRQNFLSKIGSTKHCKTSSPHTDLPLYLYGKLRPRDGGGKFWRCTGYDRFHRLVQEPSSLATNHLVYLSFLICNLSFLCSGLNTQSNDSSTQTMQVQGVSKITGNIRLFKKNVKKPTNKTRRNSKSNKSRSNKSKSSANSSVHNSVRNSVNSISSISSGSFDPNAWMMEWDWKVYPAVTPQQKSVFPDEDYFSATTTSMTSF